MGDRVFFKSNRSAAKARMSVRGSMTSTCLRRLDVYTFDGAHPLRVITGTRTEPSAMCQTQERWGQTCVHQQSRSEAVQIKISKRSRAAQGGAYRRKTEYVELEYERRCDSNEECADFKIIATTLIRRMAVTLKRGRNRQPVG